MTRRLRLTPLAEADIDAAAAWYGQRAESAAAGFLDAVDDVLDRIERAPDHAAEVVQDVRRRNLNKRYPYGIWYVIEAEGPLVIACLHHRQDRSPIVARKLSP